MQMVKIWFVFVLLGMHCWGCGTDTENPSQNGDVSENETGDNADSTPGDEDAEAGWDVDPEFESILPGECAAEVPYDAGNFDQSYTWLQSGNYTLDKNYYLLTLFNHVEGVGDVLKNDAELSALSQSHTQAFREAASTCGEDLDCHLNALTFSSDDREAAASALQTLSENGDLSLVSDHLRPSGVVMLYDDLPDDELLAKAFRIVVDGLHEALGHNAREMGAAAFDEKIKNLSDAHPGDLLFYEPLYFATEAALETQGRDEAGRYEPMEEGDNAAALAEVPDIVWENYPFSMILVPGHGPDNDEDILHPSGILRCDMAAERYAGGLAPLILVSGGHVHPDRTPYCEAVEMKKYLMETYAVPESAMLIDPHARHTTTNLRNAARLILRYGIPPEKPVLVTTDMSQSMYIAQMLDSRCLDELGYLPYREVTALGITDTCLLIDPVSLHMDPTDPLDP